MGGRPVDLVLYDYTVLGGTQSAVNHMKISRMFEHALRHRLPVICWLDGGGARTQDMMVMARGRATTFVSFARLSGVAPTIGIVPGRAFAGHANLAGMCDLLIAVGARFDDRVAGVPAQFAPRARYIAHFDVDVPDGLTRLDRLAPGDFANVARRMRALGETRPAQILHGLTREATAKEGTTFPIGFGR